MILRYLRNNSLFKLISKNLKKDLQNSNNKLIGVLATNSLLEEQSEQLLLRVHSLQCQLYSKTAPHESEIIKKKLV